MQQKQRMVEKIKGKEDLESKCPVMADTNTFSSWFGLGSRNKPISQPRDTKEISMSNKDDSIACACPIRSDVVSTPSDKKSISLSGIWWERIWKPVQEPVVGKKEYNPLTNDFIYDSKKKEVAQKTDLQTSRAVSTIPRGDFKPQHQPENVENWVYPSEQQYFNAMRKKGYNPQETDIPVVLAIHNVVNEEAWRRIREWESLRNSAEPKLARFTGRPNDISPKAYFRSLLGHDWYIDRNGTQVRYVIDFYKGAQSKTEAARDGLAPVAIYMDVRPALDSFTAFYDRALVTVRKELFGASPPMPRQIGSSSNNNLGTNAMACVVGSKKDPTSNSTSKALNTTTTTTTAPSPNSS